MIDYKKVARVIAYHSKILLRGFSKMLYGAAMAAVMALTVDGFMEVSSEGGYVAVCDFIFAVALAIISLCGLYWFGCKKGGRR